MVRRIERLRQFVQEMTVLVEADRGEPVILQEGRRLLGALVAVDDWLPPALSAPHPQFYRQYLLHCDPRERFSVVSFVWGPGQKTPVHDHTVWGLIGMLRGAETCLSYVRDKSGRLRPSAEERLEPGQVTAVSPRIGDIHAVANAYRDRASISIHVYGANIGAVRRHVFRVETGQAQDFVSGYSNASMPNLWDRSAEMRAG